jgi:hypothetical protein
MARVTLLRPATFDRDNFFYNVDAAVGAGCPNKRDDVLLVQHFLITINNNPNAFSPPIPTIPLPPNQIFRPDGVAGPITVRAIEHFQEVGRGRGNDITVDGRVDKASGTGFGTISNTQFTILFLNNAYRKIRVGVFQNISILAGDCPPELRSALSLG